MALVLQELRKLLNHKHQLTDLLIQPIQRIMRYQLLLTEILRWASGTCAINLQVDVC